MGADLNREYWQPFSWMDESLGDAGEGTLLASRILAGITRALQENHSTIPRLFWAVNRGASGVLELEEFIEGLVKLRVLQDDEVVTLKVLAEAMALIDPDFDGRVNYPALNRAVTSAQNLQRKQAQATVGPGSRGPMAACASYGAELPVDVVKVDKNSKSVFDFNRSKDMFYRQQAALLAHHGEAHRCAGMPLGANDNEVLSEC